MKKPLALAAAAALALVAGVAHADRGGVSWSVGISVPGVTTVIGDGGRVAYAPPAAYYSPAPAYYAPAPAYYAPAPAYYPPAPVYAPAPSYYPPAAAYYPPAPVYAPQRAGYGAPIDYYAPRPAYAPSFVVPQVARVAVPYRHHPHGWGAGQVAYTPGYYHPAPLLSPRPYDRHWR